MSENPRLRPIGDLLNENFFVPRYQRGYRWGKQEITELLDDILQYSQLTQDRENKVSKFYCLQPIVVKKKLWQNDKQQVVEGWELIDGQQRLTTILIILNYLEDIRRMMNDEDHVYSIDFETRQNCKQFLRVKLSKQRLIIPMLIFTIYQKGYDHIKTWFDTNKNKLEVLNTIIRKEYNVSIIWYEAQDTSEENDYDSIKLFTRLNEGKIPLTDAELIKALLLQADLYPANEERYVKQRLFEIASEWDEIEAALQDEKMWLFINPTQYQPSSKIELIFSLLAEKWNEGEKQTLIKFDIFEGKPKHFEYLIFEKYLIAKRNELKINSSPNRNAIDSINEIWKDIKDVYSVFKEWYEDHTLFHYMGYLLAVDSKNKEKFIKESYTNTLDKEDFVTHLRKEIAKSVKIKKKTKDSEEIKKLNELIYGKDNNELINILLLFNVESLLKHQKENARFPFHLFKKEKITSIEHIHPQNPEQIDTDEVRGKIWLESHYASLKFLKPKSNEQKDKIDDLLHRIKSLLANYDTDTFKNVYSEALELYTEIADFKENEMHTLYNLALVDKDTNSSLNNSFFDVKREILKANKLNRYLPIGTQRAFSKYYSNSPQEMIFWNSEDRASYYGEIKSIYESFVKLLE